MAGKTFADKMVGILALQGDVALHIRALERFGVKAIAVKSPAQLQRLDGLVIPGGESTALLKLCKPMGMLDAITAFAKGGRAVFGTCAGAILLAAEVTNPVQESLGLIDMAIKRNGFGRQIDSMETTGQAQSPLGKRNVPITFIRAPRITAVGPDAEILMTYGKEPVLVQQKNVLAATFHPELQDDDMVYTYWLDKVMSGKGHV